MTLVYALAILIGAGGVLTAVGLSVNPERPGTPPPVRHTLLAVLGFGLGGMSASFGGWPTGLAVVAGLGGAILLVGLGIRYAPIGGE
jgi:hypothetical protein